MKNVLVWTTYILNLLIALPALALLFLFGMGSWGNVVLPAIACTALFFLLGHYQYYNIVYRKLQPEGETSGDEQKCRKFKLRRRAVAIEAVVLFMVLVPFGCFLRDCGVNTTFRPKTINAADYQQAMSTTKSANWLKERMIPKGAKDIEFFHESGFGSTACLKCSCSQESLKEFAMEQGYDFQGENLRKNSDPDNPGDIGGCHTALEHFHAEEANGLHEIKNFLAYNNIHRNGGGFAFLYLVDRQILYGWYAHH